MTLGRYKLREKLGEGGCGTVYVAEQTEPVRRKVALKVIARFEAERQALAMMDHPNIAKVLDAGTIGAPDSQLTAPNSQLPQGRPYFVMELVRGIRITDYCDQANLSTKERLDLFIKVCQAIQHAHQKGIIHRDIKPSNILVTLHDGVPVPKVIDFGIAKATEGRLTDATVYTQLHQFMGTPAYMSPEQAEMSGLDIDTRSDIYSLGVLLYQLLTSKTPFDGKELLALGIDEMRRTIREKEPMRPSTRLATLQGQELTTTAKRRSVEGTKLIHLLKGDLDWIVMKALEKDRTRRYDTANGLAQDIIRHLSNEPVVARPPSTAYKIQKAWQRNKLAFSAVTAVALALVVGISVSTWQAFRATRAEREKAGLLTTANEAKANEETQRRLAERHAAQAQAAVTRLEIDRAEMLFDTGQSAEALAYLARVVRREPTNRVAGERIISALAHRNFCVPLFRLEHTGDVTSAEFSPDGQRVLTACKDNTARIYDGRTGQPLLGPFQHTGEVTAAHFSPNGTRVVTVSMDKTARIWDAQTGRPVTGPLRHEDGLLCADFSPDGQRVATGSADGSMRLWNAVTGARLETTGTLGAAIKHVKFSPDGQWIALGSSPDHHLRLLNAAEGTVIVAYNGADTGAVPSPSFSPDGTRLITLPSMGILDIIGPGFGSSNRVTGRIYNSSTKCVVFSPDGQYVASSSVDGRAKLWDAGTLQPVGKEMRHDNWVEDIGFSPDGERIVTASRDQTARIWAARNGQPLSEPLRHDANVVAVQFSSDGQRILSRCEGRGVWVWEVRGDQPLAATLQHPHHVRRAVFSPDGERALTTTVDPFLANNLVRLWDVKRAIPLLPPLGHGSYDVQFSRDGRLVMAVFGGVASVWNSTNGQVVGGPFQNTNASTARFSPDGQLVVVGGGYGSGSGSGFGSQVRVWRVATGSLVAEFSHESTAGFAQFSPDGRWVISTSEDKTARLWDWQTGKAWTEPLHHDAAVVWADVSADSQRVITLSRDQTARIWEASSGKLLHTLPHAKEPYHFNSVQFSPDGRLVVVASGNTAQIWNAHTGQPVTAPLKHAGRVDSVRFSPDGKRLVTACHDATARLWDTGTGYAVSEPLQHRSRVTYAEFSPDGHWVITASEDGTARIWEVPTLSSSLPFWLADWAEGVAGQRIDERNANQSVPFDEVRRLRHTLAQVSEADEAGRWARWFFAENMTRKISPASLLTVAQLVEQRIEQSTLDSLQQAVRLSPTNGLAQARLAYVTLTNEAAPNPRFLASAEWQSRRGLDLSPNEADAWWSRAQFCEHLGRIPEAIAAMDRAISLNSTNASFWNSKGLLLEKTNRLEEALQSYTKAIELSGPWKDRQTLPALAHENRSKVNRRLNRLAEAGVDNLKARNLPQRDPGTPATHLDLSLFYNGHDDVSGRKSLAAEFDFRSAIGLAHAQADAKSTGELGEVLGIPIARKCRQLHFLHACSSLNNLDGTEVGVYRLHYADGQQKEIPIIYGAHLRDYELAWDPKEALARNSRVAWVGENKDKKRVRLFATAWENERPDVAIESLDFVSRRAGTSPWLLAITVEP